MKKITDKQIKEVGKNIVDRLHQLCPRTLSGKHKWVKSPKQKTFGGKVVKWHNYLVCGWCDMKKL